MDTMVSARVPTEIKQQGDRKLRQIGSTITELVNSAYEYLLQHGELPNARPQEAPGPAETKTLSGDAAQQFRDLWGCQAILESQSYDGSNFDQLIDEARGEYYARFA